MKVKPIWWILGVLLVFSFFYLLKLESSDSRENKKDQLELPKAPERNRSIHVSPSRVEDPDSQEKRRTIKPLSMLNQSLNGVRFA